MKKYRIDVAKENANAAASILINENIIYTYNGKFGIFFRATEELLAELFAKYPQMIDLLQPNSYKPYNH